MMKSSTSKRELIDTGRNRMFAKRDVQGRFREMDDVGRSLCRGSPENCQNCREIWPRRSRRPTASGVDQEEVAGRLTYSS